MIETLDERLTMYYVKMQNSKYYDGVKLTLTNDKRQATLALSFERTPHKDKIETFLTKIKTWSRAPDGARHHDKQTDGPFLVK
jgi:hypothetical protein